MDHSKVKKGVDPAQAALLSVLPQSGRRSAVRRTRHVPWQARWIKWNRPAKWSGRPMHAQWFALVEESRSASGGDGRGDDAGAWSHNGLGRRWFLAIMGGLVLTQRWRPPTLQGYHRQRLPKTA